MRRGGTSWLDEISCSRTATWAHEAARDIIADLIKGSRRMIACWPWLISANGSVRCSGFGGHHNKRPCRPAAMPRGAALARHEFPESVPLLTKVPSQ